MQKIFAVLVLFLMIYPTSTTSQAQTGSEQANGLYIITQPAPNILRVVGMKQNKGRGICEEGYGDAFEQAIKTIDAKYRIIDIKPISFWISTGSLTKEIYVFVEEKNK